MTATDTANIDKVKPTSLGAARGRATPSSSPSGSASAHPAFANDPRRPSAPSTAARLISPTFPTFSASLGEQESTTASTPTPSATPTPSPLNAKEPLSTIRDLLGHSSAAVTDRYLRRIGASDAVDFARERV
jgi:hypothetical protein